MQNKLTITEIAKAFGIEPEEVTPYHVKVADAFTEIFNEVYGWNNKTEEEPVGVIPSRPLKTKPTSTIEHRGNSTIKPERPKTGNIQYRGGAPKKRKRVIVDTNQPIPERKTDVLNPIMHDLLITLGILGGMVLVAIIIMKLWQ